MSRMAFINLPVKDLAKTTEFFAALGFEFDPQFTDENATRMVINEQTSAMLMVEPFFASFTGGQEVADTAKTREVLVGLSATSREEVDELVAKVVEHGGEDLGGDDQGFMYMKGFRDLDGHQWSFIFMDMSALPQGA